LKLSNLKPYPLKYIVWPTISLTIFITGFYLSTNSGLSLNYSTDSFWLRSLAENYGSGNGLIGPDGKELIYWVPLYPLLLSVWLAQIDLFALLINLFSISGVFFLANVTFKMELERPSAKLVYATSLILSTPLLMITVFFWTEAIFLFFLMLFIYGLINYLNTGSKLHLAGWIIAGWIMLMMRNAGIFFIPGAVLWILLQKEKRFYDKLTFLVFLLVMCSGFLSWNIYKIIILTNINVIGELLPAFTPVINFALVTNEIGKYLVPDIGFYFSSLVGTGFIGGVFYLAIKSPGKRISLVYLMALSYIFTFFIIPPDPSDVSRYLAPVIPLILVASSGYLSKILVSNRLNPWLGKMILFSVYCYFLIRIIKNIGVWAQIDIYNYFRFA